MSVSKIQPASNASPHVPYYTLLFFASIIFAGVLVGYPLSDHHMFADTDPLWHLASGDLVRQQGGMPYSDPWSFTAGDYRWLNISWGWDALLSFVYEKSGWPGAAALNTLTLATIMALTYVLCVIRSGQIVLSFIVLVMIIPLLHGNLRPFQITYLMTLLYLLLLGSVARQHMSAKWLFALPILAVLWVNSHGGFMLAPCLVGAYFLQACYEKNHALANRLFAAGLFVTLALLCNPYGIYILEAMWRPLTTPANSFILEWQPLVTSPANLLKYGALIALIALCARRPKNILAIEHIIAFVWLFMAITSVRHFAVFGIIAAPVIACGLADFFAKHFAAFNNKLNLLAGRYNDKGPAYFVSLAAVALVLWIVASGYNILYKKTAETVPTMADANAYILEHHPDAKLITHFNVASIILHETRGKIPVFFDARTQTAYPEDVILAYHDFLAGTKGWEQTMSKWNIDGAVIRNADIVMLDRFINRRGWKQVFANENVTIFMKEEE